MHLNLISETRAFFEIRCVVCMKPRLELEKIWTNVTLFVCILPQRDEVR